MNIRKVRMPVLHLRMQVRQWHVHVVMRMVLGEVQPDTGGHQPGSDPEQQVRRLTEQCHRQCSTNKRRPWPFMTWQTDRFPAPVAHQPDRSQTQTATQIQETSQEKR